MNIIGIIAEYNPFHLGHLYQIEKAKELYPNSIIIAIISTHFTERGDISILNKWDKTEIALQNGIDLVLELPSIFATQSADIFAYGAIDILHKFNIDTLVFGSECGDVSLLETIANTQINNPKFDSLVKEHLATGINYPTALNIALKELNIPTINAPNDLLGISYIKEIKRNNYPIKSIAIKRTNDYHGNHITSNIVNASLIRKMYLSDEDVSPYLPPNVSTYLTKKISLQDAYPFLVYSILTNKDHLNDYLDVDEGIENLLLNKINKTHTWSELVANLKSKRYTYNKLNRMLIHILLNIKKDANNKQTYLRILGFNQRGRTYLNQIKKTLPKPIYSNYKPHQNPTLDLEFYTTCIYALITKDPSLIDKEYQNKPIMK